MKTIALVTCLAGVGLIVLAAQRSSTHQTKNVSQAAAPKPFERVLGDLTILIGAVAYSAFSVAYKRLAEPVKTVGTFLLSNMWSGTIGMATLLLLWIPFPILNATGHETFRIPVHEPVVFKLWLVYVIVGAPYPILYLVAIALLPSPTFVAMGTLLTIPTSMLTDYMLFGTTMTPLALTGSGLIVAGWLTLVLSEAGGGVTSAAAEAAGHVAVHAPATHAELEFATANGP